MADDNLKKIAELIKTSLKPLRDELALINTKVRHEIAPLRTRLEVMDSRQEMTNDKLDKMQGILDGIKEMSKNVDAARGDIETIRMDVTWIKEKQGMYHSRNKREIDEIKTHLGMPLMSDVPEA